MNIFARLTKVDIARREVWGRAVCEEVDKSGEVFDYEQSKPHFKAWSDEYAKITDGSSVGNLRAMHGKVAAGKLIAIDFNDTDKAIDIGTKVVDDDEWRKVTEGVYTGFSIGGEYVGEKVAAKVGDAEVKRYVAKPSEISLVDNPCGPSARFFDVIKADGVVEKVEFKMPVADDKALDVTGNADDVALFANMLNAAGLTMKDACAAVQSEIAKRDFSQKERDKAAASGAALPDGSFPIENKSDLENAIQAYGRAKDKAKAKAHIIARAKALDLSSELPDDWKKIATADFAKFDKGMINVQCFAEVLQMLSCIAMDAESDAQWEGDESPVPEKLRAWIGEGVTLFSEMATEEAEELVGAMRAHAGDEASGDVEMLRTVRGARAAMKAVPAEDADIRVLLKHAADVMEKEEFASAVTLDAKVLRAVLIQKAGARHSAADKAHLQNAHNSMVALGADCPTPGDGDKLAPNAALVKGGTLAKQVETLTAEVAALKAQPVARVRLRTVDKAQDIDTPKEGVTMEKLLKDAVRNADGTINEAATLIKFAQATGGVPFDPRQRQAK